MAVVPCKGFLASNFAEGNPAFSDIYPLNPLAKVHSDATATLTLPGFITMPSEVVYETGLFKPPAREDKRDDPRELKKFLKDFVKPVKFMLHVNTLTDDFIKAFEINAGDSFNLLSLKTSMLIKTFVVNTDVSAEPDDMLKHIFNKTSGCLNFNLVRPLRVREDDIRVGLYCNLLPEETPISINLPSFGTVRKFLLEDNIPVIPICGNDIKIPLMIDMSGVVKEDQQEDHTSDKYYMLYYNTLKKGGLLDAHKRY